MRTRARWVAFLAAGLLGLASAGCAESNERRVPVARDGGAVSNEDTATDADASALDGAPKLGEIVCARRMQCAGDYGFPYDDREACERIEQRNASASSRPGTRQACEEALAALDCEALIMREWPEPCESLVVTPRTRPVEDGELCGHGSLCEEGSKCVAEGDNCGRCQPALAAGEACISGAECESYRCGDDGKCEARASLGDSCAGYNDCEHGLNCVQDVCKAAPVEGEACEGSERCAAGSYCNFGGCVPFAIPKLGDACSAGSFACTAYKEGVRYGAGLACIDGVCSEAPGAGEACTDTCREGYSCLEGSCAAIASGGSVGDACMYDSCSAELICTFDGCARPAGLGEPWLSTQLLNAGCAPDLYGGFENDAHVCLERVPDGEPCDEHNQCLGGLCDADGLCAQSACNQQD